MAEYSPRVLHIVPSLFRKDGGILGGAERYVYELARHMAEMTDTRLLAFGPKSDEIADGNLRIQVVKPICFVRNNFGNPLSLKSLRSIYNADVIHCHQKHILNSSLSALTAKIFRKPVFVTDYGGGGWDISAYFSTDSWYDGDLHISEYSKQIVGKENFQNHVIFGGVDTLRFCPDPSVVKDDSILFVGRILSHKGIDVLIEALDLNMSLKIVGQPYDSEYLMDLKRLAKGKKVSFHHDFNDCELVRSYRAAKVIVLPSVYRDCYGRTTKVPELLGQTLLEGMACGTAAICTDVASMPEIVRHSIDGFIVAPNDVETLRERLKWLFNNPSEASTMGKNARQRVLDKFVWSRVVQHTLEIYQQREVHSLPVSDRNL